VRTSWITGQEALRQRLINPAQIAFTEPEAEMPPYMESFLSHLRLLVGVPFEYLIPDPRMLPDESIRFFYLDRSWTDRLVDGAISVGKVGTREQAHHQAHHGPVSQQLDFTERIVRDLQRGTDSFPTLKGTIRGQQPPADIITGFLLRSGAVSGWPTMDVRAYRTDLSEPLDPANPESLNQQLRTLRLERLSPSILLALFQGVPQLVYLEEPHHLIQFGVRTVGSQLRIDLRDSTGHQIRTDPNNPRSNPIPQTVHVRAAHNRVVAIANLRRDLITARNTHPQMPEQTGSAAFAIEVLSLPWRQRFEGVEDQAEKSGGSGAFVSVVMIGSRVTDLATKTAFVSVLAGGGG
jgi:hypothetical protein